MLNGLDLFSGIGGISIALGDWVRTVAYCENDHHAQAVLLSRMRDDSICRAPIWDDVRTLRGDMLAGGIDIISGGFPCQDISIAGDGAGLGGSRSGLFFEVVRLTRELRPAFVFLENVPAITVRGLDRVLLEFTSLGYDCRWTIVSAQEVGAPHLRERWFLLAHSNGKHVRLSESGQRREALHAAAALEDGEAPNANGSRLAFSGTQVGLEPKQPFGLDLLEGNDWDEYAAFLRRMDHGLPNRSHGIRGLGNSVVPQAVREAFIRLSGLEREVRLD